MAKENILIIGNKPFKNLNLSSYIDSFDKIYRCNLATVGSTNGHKFGSLVMCQHIYDRFVAIPIPKNEIMNFYESEYESDFLNDWFDFFQKHKNDFKNIYYLNEEQKYYFNDILEEYGCPFRFNRMPTTGSSLIMTLLRDSDKDVNIFISNFTIDRKENRKSSGVTKFQTDIENSDRGCHSFSEEIEIVRWLHQNKKIDASLCSLDDINEISVIKTNQGLEFSGFISNLINNI